MTRQNIFSRDLNTCQYCGVVFPGNKLTLDHVLPRSRGGRDSWENLVTCCASCNHRKADRTPDDAGMALIRMPHAVNVHAARSLMRIRGEDFPLWLSISTFDYVLAAIAQRQNTVLVHAACARTVTLDTLFPIGGVVASRDAISPSGVGFDIACGNKAVRLDMPGHELRANIASIMDDVWSIISFGVGRKTKT